METADKPLYIKLMGLTYLFLLLIVAPVLTLLYSIITFRNGIISASSIVTFHKGTVYAIPAFLFGLWAIYLCACKLLKIKNSRLTEKRLNYLVYISLGALIVLPPLSKTGVNYYMDKISYYHCRELSTRWLHSETLIYTATPQICKLKHQEIKDEAARAKQLRQERRDAAQAINPEKQKQAPTSRSWPSRLVDEDVFA